MTVTYLVGDVFDRMATLPAGSVDLVLTSPPFLALRSYLPADHPDKGREIGSEATPAEYLSTLLALTAEWRRLLKPTGSLCVELGDTYSGTGGAGGDWSDSPATTLARVKGGGDGGPIRRTQSDADDRWPLAKSLVGVPHLYWLSLAYGRNLLTGAPSPAGRWRVRNVVAWCRPNPPVGALGDKYRPATSYLTVACTSPKRWFDLDAVREPNTRGHEVHVIHERRDAARAEVGLSSGGNIGRGMVQNPEGSPPLDYWEVPARGYRGAHYATWPEALLVRPIVSMSPPGGTILDPFAGSGSTLAVAQGHGRHAIGIDLDERNAYLARERVGMFLEIDHGATGGP